MPYAIFFSILLCFVSWSAYAAEKKAWTILVYAAGDEAEIGIQTRQMLKRLEAVPGIGKEGNVNIIVQHDDLGEDANYRYALQHIKKPSSKNGADSEPVPESEIQKTDPSFHYGEKDSANPATLKNFLNWGVKNYPANHYGVIIAGHSWGMMGIAQDFHRDGKDLKNSSMIRNYELRRVMEEVIRENRSLISQDKFDFYLADVCVAGQLEIADEIKDQFKYFAASPIETPFTSIPYEKVFPSFVNAVNSEKKLSSKKSDQILEKFFFKPLVEEYVKSHARNGSLVENEGELDPVELFVLRTSRIKGVNRSLQKLLKALPDQAYDEWQAEQIPELDKLTDMDHYADMKQLAKGVQAYAIRKGNSGAWRTVYVRAKQLERSLGGSAKDPAAMLTVLEAPKAKGVWAEVNIDEAVDPRQLAVCIALKSFIMMNFQNKAVIPKLLTQKKKEVDAFDLDCNATNEEYEKEHPPEKELPLKSPSAMKKIFDYDIVWPQGVPVYVSEEGNADGKIQSRKISIWIDSQGKDLKTHAQLRLLGTTDIRLSYLSDFPEEYIKDPNSHQDLLAKPVEHQQVPEYVVDHWNDGLLVTEGHTNATQFKSGLGISIRRENFEKDKNMGGRIPLELVEKKPFAMKMEDYLTSLGKDLDTQKIRGQDFYRLHLLAKETDWAKFFLPKSKPDSPRHENRDLTTHQ